MWGFFGIGPGETGFLYHSPFRMRGFSAAYDLQLAGFLYRFGPVEGGQHKRDTSILAREFYLFHHITYSLGVSPMIRAGSSEAHPVPSDGL